MDQKSMTALVSAYARAYHYKNNSVRVFADDMSEKLLTNEEYLGISQNMTAGIKFFNPEFDGAEEEALRWIVDNYLSPSPLGRAVFTETMLERAVSDGAEQYVIWAAGYDSFAYRQPSFAEGISIFEIDHPTTSNDKQERLLKLDIGKPRNAHYIETDFNDMQMTECLKRSNVYDTGKASFHSLLGLSYYLTKDVFSKMLLSISGVSGSGSSIVFDYPDELCFTHKAEPRMQKQVMLASGSGEPMLASYSYSQLESMLKQAGFSVSEHLTPDEITTKYFSCFNSKNPSNKITAFDNVNYCLAVKK